MLSRHRQLSSFCSAFHNISRTSFFMVKRWLDRASHYNIQTLEGASSHVCSFREETSQLTHWALLPTLKTTISKSNGITTIGLEWWISNLLLGLSMWGSKYLNRIRALPPTKKGSTVVRAVGRVTMEISTFVSAILTLFYRMQWFTTVLLSSADLGNSMISHSLIK